MNVTCLRSSRPPAFSKELRSSRYLNSAEDKWAEQKTLPLSTTFKIIVFECNCQYKNWIGKFLLNYPFQIINAQKKITKHEQLTYAKKKQTCSQYRCSLSHPMWAVQSYFINPPDHSTMSLHPFVFGKTQINLYFCEWQSIC